MKITILGAGAFGTALGKILTENNNVVDYYDPFIKKECLKDKIQNDNFIVLCVPSKAAPFLLPHLPKDKPLIVATKGILSNRLFMSFNDYMVLSGPGFAQDIKKCKHAELTVTDKRLMKLFKTDYLSFDYTNDKNGVLMCGALKNVYAIKAGLLGLERDSEKWQKFIMDVCFEMKKILAFNNANPDTVDLVCGIGDLKLTCGYPSRNYEYGDKKRIDSNYQPEKTVEGLSAIKRIIRHEILLPKDTPILESLITIFS